MRGSTLKLDSKIWYLEVNGRFMVLLAFLNEIIVMHFQ